MEYYSLYRTLVTSAAGYAAKRAIMYMDIHRPPCKLIY